MWDYGSDCWSEPFFENILRDWSPRYCKASFSALYKGRDGGDTETDIPRKMAFTRKELLVPPPDRLSR